MTGNAYNVVSWNRCAKTCWLMRLRHLGGHQIHLNRDMCRSESSQNHENRSQSANSPQACRKPKTCDYLFI